MKPEEQRELVKYAITEHELSERQACRAVNLNRCTYRYQARKTDDHEIVQELQQLSEKPSMAEQPGFYKQAEQLIFFMEFVLPTSITERQLANLEQF